MALLCFLALLVSFVCAVPRFCACVCMRDAYYEDQSFKKQYSSFQYPVLHCSEKLIDFTQLLLDQLVSRLYGVIACREYI